MVTPSPWTAAPGTPRSRSSADDRGRAGAGRDAESGRGRYEAPHRQSRPAPPSPRSRTSPPFPRPRPAPAAPRRPCAPAARPPPPAAARWPSHSPAPTPATGRAAVARAVCGPAWRTATGGCTGGPTRCSAAPVPGCCWWPPIRVATSAAASGSSSSRLFLVPALPRTGDARGLVRRRLTALDETRPQARVELRDVPAEPLGGQEAGDPRTALARTGVLAAAALAAEAVGAASRALAGTLEYVGVGEQFGRPVGSFQAVKHRLADLYVQVQTARSAACYAAWAVGSPPEQAPDAAVAGTARPRAGPRGAARRVGAGRRAARRHRLHRERHAHLYVKRPPPTRCSSAPCTRCGAKRPSARASSPRLPPPRPRPRPRPGGGRRHEPVADHRAEGAVDPGVRQGRTACRPGGGPVRAPGDPRQGAAQRPDAARAGAHRHRRVQRPAPAHPAGLHARGGRDVRTGRQQLRPHGPSGMDGESAEAPRRGGQLARPGHARTRGVADGRGVREVWAALLEFWPPHATYARCVERRIRLFRLVPREKGGGAPVEP